MGREIPGAKPLPDRAKYGSDAVDMGGLRAAFAEGEARAREKEKDPDYVPPILKNSSSVCCGVVVMRSGRGIVCTGCGKVQP